MSAPTSTPLIEALCEFRFQTDGDWDLTLPGLLYDKVRADFPDIEQPTGMPIEFHAGETKQIVLPTTPPLVRFCRTDRAAMIQIGPGLLAVNHFAAGYDWASFRSMIIRTQELHFALAPRSQPVRVGLRYINRIPLTHDLAGLSEIVSVKPKLQPSMDQNLSGLYQRLEFQYGDPDGTLLLQVATQGAGSEKSVVVDLDFGTPTSGPPLHGSALHTWLEAAHARVKLVFFSTLTPAQRASYGFLT